MEAFNIVQKIAIWVLPVLFAITVHEAAHGWVAKLLGDPTAERLGRLTFNPIKHIDPVGTLLVPALLLMVSPVVFGWAKPVPVTWENLRHPKRDMALVAVAGPGANLLMLILWAILIRIGMGLPANVGTFMIYVGSAGVVINSVLMVLNLLPIPPLDGGRVMAGLLPGPWAWQLSRLEPYGFFIILGLAMLGVLGKLIQPAVVGLALLMGGLLDISPRIMLAVLW